MQRHANGLAVLLDVVYNHVGPGDEALRAFAPYLTSKHRTFWAMRIDYSQLGVREWTLQNAEQWVRDYHVDACGSTRCTQSSTTRRSTSARSSPSACEH